MARAILLQGGNSIDTDGINASSTNILKGKTTIDVNGEPLEGTIESVNASTFSPSSNVTTMVATTTAKYLAGNQTINAVTTQNFSAGNIKSGVNVKVGTTANAGSIVNITGTFGNGANVAAGRMLKDKTAYNGTSKITGTITSKAAATYNYATTAQTIASGQYLSGAQVINGVKGNANAADVRSGYTFWSQKKNSLNTGTMANFAATTANANSSSFTKTTYSTAGKYATGNLIVPKTTISGFVASNIKKGVTVTIAGSAITGTWNGYVTDAYDIYKYGSWGSGWSQSQFLGTTPYESEGSNSTNWKTTLSFSTAGFTVNFYQYVTPIGGTFCGPGLIRVNRVTPEAVDNCYFHVQISGERTVRYWVPDNDASQTSITYNASNTYSVTSRAASRGALGYASTSGDYWYYEPYNSYARLVYKSTNSSYPEVSNSAILTWYVDPQPSGVSYGAVPKGKYIYFIPSLWDPSYSRLTAYRHWDRINLIDSIQRIYFTTS